MTLREYEERLEELSSEELQKFNDDFGGGQETIQQRVRGFVDHPEHERRICQLLGLQTAQEKLTEAALRSANAADHSACSARWSMIWSGFASLVALVAAVVAFIGLFQKG